MWSWTVFTEAGFPPPLSPQRGWEGTEIELNSTTCPHAHSALPCTGREGGCMCELFSSLSVKAKLITALVDWGKCGKSS